MGKKLLPATVLAVAAVLAAVVVLRDRVAPDRPSFASSAQRVQAGPPGDGGPAAEGGGGVALAELDPEVPGDAPPSTGPSAEAAGGVDTDPIGERVRMRQPTMDELERAARERAGVAHSVFEAEYSEWTSAQLKTELDRVHLEWTAAQRRAFDELFEAGRYEVLENDEEGKPVFDGVGGGVLYSTRVSEDEPGGVQFTVLPPDEYAAIYETGDRWNWLMHASRRAAAD